MSNIYRSLEAIKKSYLPKKKIVFVSGNFNVLHAGHIRLLKYASENGDFLIVGVNKDSNTTHVSQNERIEAVAALSYVDSAFILNDLKEALFFLRPDIIVKGSENKGRFNEEDEYLKKSKATLIFSSGRYELSSFDILKREFFNNEVQNFSVPYKFIQRKSIEQKKLLDIIKKFKNLKVIVVGDTIVDEYITCNPLGMSQEEPSIVVSPSNNEKFLGGAGIVSAHASALGASVDFLTVCGDDEQSEFAINKLNNYRVKSYVIRDHSRPTTLKQRFRCHGKTLLKVNYLRNHKLSKKIFISFINNFKKLVDKFNYNLLIFSDFSYGVLSQDVIDEITKICSKKEIMITGDSQSSSQLGDILKFKNMKLITPTEHEIRLAFKDNESGLVELSKKLISNSNVENIFITLGVDGIFIFNKSGIDSSSGTDQIPALNFHAKDVSGAGDSLLAGSSLALAAGANIWYAAYLGSLMSAIQVSTVGNNPIEFKILNNFIKK